MFGSIPSLGGLFKAATVGLLLASVVGAGCGGSSRRLSEAEAIRYKQELIRSSGGAITPVQAEKLMLSPARTRPEIDRYFAQLQEEARAERELEKRSLESRPAGKAAKSQAGGEELERESSR